MPIISILFSLLNFKKFIPMIIKNWRAILIGLMAFIIWYQNFNETRFLFGSETIPSLEKQIKAAKDAVAVCKAGNVTLSDAIDNRNAEVEKWKTISTGLEGDINILQKELNNTRTKTNTQVETILKGNTPKTCKESIDYLRNSRKDLQWEK